MAKKLSFLQNAAYNTVGSIFYCFCQWATTLLVVKMFDGYESAGVFQLAISITNIFYAISHYNIRVYQVSDVKEEFSSREYTGLRTVTCTVALLLCTVYAIILNYPVKTVLCIIAYMVFKLNESLSDVLHGVDQKHSRMDYVGISYIIRGFVMIGSFAAAIKLSGDILIATTVMAFATTAAVFIYDVNKTRRLEEIRPKFNFAVIKNMLIKCLPMVLASASFTAIVTVPRQFLESMYGESILGFYATVATPIVIVQVFATSVFNPMLTSLSENYASRNIKQLRSAFIKTALFILGFTAVAFIGAALLGEFALVLLYNESIREYAYLMYAIIGCTSLYTVCWFLTSLLTVMRRLKTVTVFSLAALALAAICSKPLISAFYMNGVSFTVIFCYVIYSILSAGVIIYDLRKVMK